MTEDDWAEQSAADDAALAAGFTNVTGTDAAVSHDGAGVPVVDVDRAGWLAAARHARDDLELDFADWLSAVDQPDGDPAGADVVLHIASSRSAGSGFEAVRRLLLRTRVPDATPVLASLTAVWPGVAWHERETFEMFGITFEDFEDAGGLPLRPLLLPDGFEGTPLRKSFMLAARASKAWPGAKEPGESGEGRSPGRRKVLPPGVPPATWGPRAPGEVVEPEPERPARTPRRPATARTPRPDRPPRPNPTEQPERDARPEGTEQPPRPNAAEQPPRPDPTEQPPRPDSAGQQSEPDARPDATEQPPRPDGDGGATP